MQTLRKKTSPLKYKNETSRFLGEGVSFKAKLIGILEVSEARGDRMCQEALSDLKMAIRAAGEHKQRITINIAIDGLRLRDEKTGDSLYHHPVHKISFIAQDMTDSRAFGYIFGSPDTGHRFFGIKTDKAASQVVIAMRDLFQVVFALKKKEIELAKQHLDKNRYGTSSIFSDSTIASAKMRFCGINKVLSQDTTSKATSDIKSGATNLEAKVDAPAVADLVDLELELNSLQQGISQMERITPSDPFGSKDDPFGDSFTSYPPKPILPPPPSTRERSNRTSDSGSIFSPKTPRTGGSTDGNNAADVSMFNSERNFNFSHELNSSHDEPSSGDWFTPTSNDKMFDEPPLVPEPTKEQQHELTKQEILSQFDVFTELDPLGMSTGKIKPYIDKKDFFQELKNPPKKVLNDLVSEKQPQDTKLFNANFEQLSTTPKLTASNGNGTFNSDPFGDDPFDKTDPFAESEFSRQDPFETETFGAEFKVFNKDIKPVDFEKLKFPTLNNNENMSILNSKLSKSPNKISVLEKQMSLVSGSIRTVQFNKQNTFDDKLSGKISQSHENRSLDMSSESECAPEPPPRPTSNFIQIKPPPLPPKKQPGEIYTKPPPRPPYSDDYLDNYEMGSSEQKKFDKSPPLPAPARKVKLDSDFTTPPQRPKKQFNLQQGWSSEEDYLTPISFPNQSKEYKSIEKSTGPILLPPPQKSTKKYHPPQEHVTVGTYVETKPNVTSTNTQEKLTSLEGLDITLSQLTLSGLNEVASKLNIPAGQLSNMTLVQLTEYISNFIKSKTEDNSVSQFSDFKADFSNLNNFNEEPHDKYAVFRELLEEEIKQTKIDTEPEEHIEARKKEEEKLCNLDVKLINENEQEKTDRYAALREIVVTEIKPTIQDEESVDENNINEAEIKDECNNLNVELNCDDTKIKNETNILNSEKLLSEKELSPKDQVIDYTTNVESKQDTISAIKSPVKIKSPIPAVVSDVIQSNNRLTSGSLSDVISGSSPEVDNTGSTSEVVKKTVDAAGESWAIFDQPNLCQQVSRDKQSEEGISPWSSDSKEFGNGSPSEWRHRTDSGSGAERWACHRREQEGWWDTSAEPEVQYIPTNRRSTDSYEEEGCEYYDRPHRRRRQTTWSSHGGGGARAAGDHSSSSRDASPWEEEPRRRDRDPREHRETWSSRHSRQQHSFERQRDRRHADSWDEEDDYEYDEEHSGRYHWPERHKEFDKDRHTVGVRERDTERWSEEWNESRRHRRRRDTDRDRWCCPDWEQDLGDQSSSRYGGNRWRDRKHEERYYPREPQESPWEEEYPNDPEASHSRYLMATKRNWKRPSSASEMDRKTGETKARPSQYYVGTGGSDGERDRRYKTGRRSKSRDSQFSELATQSRHKIDPNLTLRGNYRTKLYLHQKAPLEPEFSHEFSTKKVENSKTDLSNKRSATLGNRKKTKDNPKTDQLHTFVRKTTFENNFLTSETESPISASVSPRFTFENDFETSEAESSVPSKPVKNVRHPNLFENSARMKPRLRYDTRKTTFEEDTRISPSRNTQKSPFEDDFSPPVEKSETILHKNISTSSIKEEIDVNEEEDSFTTNNFDKNTIRKKILNKNRTFHVDTNLKKSESVNIFARESDPFDDEFFSGGNLQDPDESDKSPRSSDHKWTENFDHFDFGRRK